MKCLVCTVSWPDANGQRCPQCGYDHAAAEAKTPASLNAARAAFHDKTTAFAPDSRVSTWDRWRPWAAVVMGFLLFVLWLRACSTHGFM